MKKQVTIRQILFTAVAVLIGLPLMAWVWGSPSSEGTIALAAPPFVQERQGSSGFADTEAGIAAYFNAGQTIDLSKVKTLYRSIETQTNDYIIGSVGVPDYDEDYDPHVYIHKDGWIMAYYHKKEPTSKIIDWRHYGDKTVIPTMFEQVLVLVAGKIGASTPTLTYYHFAYPNANKLMLVAEFRYDGGTAEFSIKLPPGPKFQFFEKSWSLAENERYGYWIGYFVDDIKIAEIQSHGWSIRNGVFEAQALTADKLHTIKIITHDRFDPNEKGMGGLALVYREQ